MYYVIYIAHIVEYDFLIVLTTAALHNMLNIVNY